MNAYDIIIVGAGPCYQVCDANAIEFRYPSGGTGVIFEKG